MIIACHSQLQKIQLFIDFQIVDSSVLRIYSDYHCHVYVGSNMVAPFSVKSSGVRILGETKYRRVLTQKSFSGSFATLVKTMVNPTWKLVFSPQKG